MTPPFTHQMRAHIVVTSLLLTAAGMLTLMSPAAGSSSVDAPHRAFTGWPQGRDKVAAPSQIAQAAAKPAGPEAPSTSPAAAQNTVAQGPSLNAYKGLGVWVDQFDFGKPGTLSPELVVSESARRGVRTIYVQTGKWNTNVDIMNQLELDRFLELAHANRMKVVGWYLPGFNDIATDVRRSMAIINYRSPSGHRFDGFGPDIEDRVAVGKDLARFNAGIIEYSRQLRAAAGPNYALGAIVVDSKNNKRAPSNWAGFPWPEIGQNYDIILPMAYWSVTKKQAECGNSMDVAAYQREVIAETDARMGQHKPYHLIGGIADCNSPDEINAFVDVTIETGSLGGSLYDFWTTQNNPHRELLWGHLSRLNRLAPQVLARP